MRIPTLSLSTAVLRVVHERIHLRVAHVAVQLAVEGRCEERSGFEALDTAGLQVMQERVAVADPVDVERDLGRIHRDERCALLSLARQHVSLAREVHRRRARPAPNPPRQPHPAIAPRPHCDSR